MDDDGEGAFFCIEIGKVKQQKATIEEKDVVTSPAVVGDSVVSSFFLWKADVFDENFRQTEWEICVSAKDFVFWGGKSPYYVKVVD